MPDMDAGPRTFFAAGQERPATRPATPHGGTGVAWLTNPTGSDAMDQIAILYPLFALAALWLLAAVHVHGMA